MSDQDFQVFTDLLQEAYSKCFGVRLSKPVTESESRHWSHEIEEKTGLVVGWKSIKNYVAFILADLPDKAVNPTVATLDTLARYVSGAPATTEILRKKNDAHYPYWFRYREKYPGEATHSGFQKQQRSKSFVLLTTSILGVILISGAYFHFKPVAPLRFAEDFHSVEESYFLGQGWMLQSLDPVYWNRRNERPGNLTLFTLPGDNWPKTGEQPVIRNLLLQKTPDDCFSTEVHFSEFIPKENWQQAGLLLLEDTAFAGKSIRLSLSYNDFFGGFSKPGEVIVQGIASYGKNYPNLEEVVHQSLFTFSPGDGNRMLTDNLKYSALRIEKHGNMFRFLYAASPNENFSFKELTTYPFDMHPRFVGIFALRGFVDTAKAIPVNVQFFRLEGQACR